MSAVPTKENARLAGLDGLRGIACLLVFFYHLRWHARPSAETRLALDLGPLDIEAFLQCCDIGVAIFFILSGLLLSMPFWRALLNGLPAPKTGPYLWRRACRIVPAYYAVLVVIYLLRESTYTFYGALEFLLHATFLHNFADSTYNGILPVLWTIGIEFQFYLLLPVIMVAIATLYRKYGVWPALGALFVGTWLLDIAWRAVLAALAPHVPDRFLADSDSLVVGGTIFAYLKLFAFGIAAALAVLRWPWSRRAGDAMCAISIVGTALLIACGNEADWRETSAMGWPLNALILAALATSLVCSNFFARIASARWLAATGTISYGIYLWHEVVQRAVFGGTLKNNLQGWPLFLIGGAIAMAVTMLIAALSWRFIERTALRTPYPFQP